MKYNKDTKTYTMELKDALALFKKIPFMVEEFNEIQGLDSDASAPSGEFRDPSGFISPLLSYAPTNTSASSPLLDVALSTFPYYVYSSPLYSETRDPLELDVPRNMRNGFWSILFRDALATENNSLINNLHNKLKYVNLSEEHILNRGLFKKLISMGADLLPEEEQWANVPLTLQESIDDEETLDTVVAQKLSSIYTLLGYSPPQSSLIDDWISSLYLSGQMDYQIKLREENLFKVQDLKSELLRRKFAGSVSLYKILLSSINRSGTFAPVLPLFSVTGATTFKDNRSIRALDMPGITTRTGEVLIDPLTTYKDKIPARTIYPLYYTSSNYNADKFEENATQYLRNYKPIFAWDNLRGIIDASLVKNTYPRLDQPDPTGEDGAVIKFDSGLYLDEATSFFDMSSATGTFFDLQADQILYHRNSLQEELGQDYPFVTYTLSGDSSLSMMDFPWLEFIESALDRKTRVQEQVDVGVQVSRLVNDEASRVTDNIVIITFSEKFTPSINSQDSKYHEGHRYAYLWNVGIRYDALTYMASTSAKLITYLLLKVSDKVIPENQKSLLSSHPSYKTFTSYSTGLLPFSYQNITQEDIFNMKMSLDKNESGEFEIVDDLYEEEYTKAIFLFTPHENVAITKGYLKKAPEVLLGFGDQGSDEPVLTDVVPLWFAMPSNDVSLKHFIYGIERYNEDLKIKEWFWSEPVRIYPKELLDGLNERKYHPDWKGLVGYYNPYLNTIEKSSSPLRGKPSLFRGLKPATLLSEGERVDSVVELTGPASNAMLMNINLDRGQSVYSSQTGNEGSLRGTYLYRNTPAARASDPEFSWNAFIENETLQIWGDNRPLWDEGSPYALDPADNWDGGLIRSQWTYDDQGLACITFKPGVAYGEGKQHIQYYDLRPEKKDNNTSGWKEWVWNDTPTSGMTACIDLMLFEAPVGNEDYYLLSRSKGEDAEFDFYIDRSGPLTAVMNVYPEGKLNGIVFTCSLGPNPEPLLIYEQQTQMACSYYYEEVSEDTLQITQSIVIDRRWTAVYRVIVKDGNKYHIYETDSSFNIEGLTPTTITSTDSSHFFGQLVKNKGGNNLEGINLFNRDYGRNPVLGNLYDFRLYNRGMHLYELLVSCAGSRKELYSYSPSIYKLGYQHFTDIGIIKKRTPYPPAGESKAIGRVRVFSRSVWDSVLTDMHPVSVEEVDATSDVYDPRWEDPFSDKDIYVKTGPGADDYSLKPGVIEQLLVPHYETSYDISFPSGQEIYYKNAVTSVDDGTFSFVQTSLYPISYENERFHSTFKLTKDPHDSTEEVHSYKAYFDPSTDTTKPEGANRGNLPSAPAGNSLLYKADLDINFDISHNIDLGAPFVRGANIITSKRKGSMSLTHAQGNTSRKTSKNLALVPFYVPDQKAAIAIESIWDPQFHKFSMSKVTLASGLARMLNATSYYNELQIPIPYDDDEGNILFTSRWDAIRVMKEGEYYFTCKYPFQVMPLKNADSAKGFRYPTYYASIRFKVVVTGEPVHYEEEIEGLPGNWLHDSLNNFLEGNMYTSIDNRSYPHRNINIDLYALDDVAIDANVWRWEKVASNYDSSVQLITSNFLREPTLDSPVSAFFSSTYLTPFFDKNGDFDLLTIKVTRDDERFVPPSTILKMGNSYKLLFDYTAQLTELKYNSVARRPSIGESIGEEEFDAYNHSFNLLEDSYEKAAYSSLLDWSHLGDDFDLTSTTTGYYVNANNEFAEINTSYLDGNLSMGNPYSQASNNNMLLEKFSNRRGEINSLGYFPYRIENLDAPLVVAPRVFGPTPLTRLPELNRYSGNYLILSPSNPVDEYGIIRNHHQAVLMSVQQAFNALKSSPSGVFEALSVLTPKLKKSISYISTEVIKDRTHSFVAYQVEPRELSSFSGYDISRRTPLGANLLLSNDFSLRSLFLSPSGYYTYDEDLDKDVWIMGLGTSSSYTLKYLNAVSTTSTVRIQLKTNQDIKVALNFKGIDFDYTTDSQTLLASKGWNYITFELEDGRQANNMSLVFTAISGNLQEEEVRINEWTLRQSFLKEYSIGLAESLTLGSEVAGSETVIVPGFTSICFKRKDSEGYFPIQALNTPAFLSREESPGYVQSFIGNYRIPLVSSGNETALFKPWKCRLKYSQEAPEDTALYPFVYMAEGNANVEKASSNPIAEEGIFEVFEDSINFVPSTYLEFGGNEGQRGLLFRPGKFEDKYKLALKINSAEPFTITNERFTMVSNCFNYEKFKRGISSPVAITNIQLLSASEENPVVLYELEYLPIIYDELKHHFSLNLLLRE